MTSIALFLLFSATVAGAVIYRMRGGWPSWPRPIEQMLFCSVFAFVCAALDAVWWHNGIGYALAVVAVLTGHGQFFLNMAIQAVEPERVDFILRMIFGRDPRTDERFAEYRNYVDWYNKDPEKLKKFKEEIKPQIAQAVDEYGTKKLFWRCVSGMALTGGIVSLAPGIVLMISHFWAGLALALSGFLSKSLAYLVSHKLGFGTEGGEFGTGGLQWFIATAILILTAGLLTYAGI